MSAVLKFETLRSLPVSLRPESMAEVVASVVRPFRAVAAAAGVHLSVKVQPDLPEVPMDRCGIQQVLANALDNAIRFTPPKGRVLVIVGHFPKWSQEITVSICDTGCGMPVNRLGGLFERSAAALPAGGDGSAGSGLYLCSRIVRSHKGRISINSLPEAGTCLSFTLPLETGHLPLAGVQEEPKRRKAYPFAEAACLAL